MRNEDADFTLIRSARLIDGTGAPPLERGALLIEGDTVRAVGTQEAVTPPEAASVQVLDYGDRTVLPGLVDCHVHLNGIGDGRMGDELAALPDEVLTVQSAENARRYLGAGVTTIRDCGAKNRTTFMLREAVKMGLTSSPRLVLSGRPVAIIGGHLSYFGVGATGLDECRAAVRQLVKEGADFIKITASGGSTRTSHPMRPSFDVDELTTIVDEAHKFGKHTAAHCVNSQAILNALDAGVDTIIHGRHAEPDGSYAYRPEITEKMVKRGVFLNATLAQAKVGVQRLEDKQRAGSLTESELSDLARLRSTMEITFSHFERVRSEGVRMVCGSDASWAYYPMGDFQPEVEAHVEIGMSPIEAIAAATSESAKSCCTDDQVGTLKEGMKADVLVVDGDPSKNIKDLRRVVNVFSGGQAVVDEPRISGRE